MPNKSPWFDHVYVMDPLHLTGPVICQIVNEMNGCPYSTHVASIKSLEEKLKCDNNENILIIMELFSDKESILDGLNFIENHNGTPSYKSIKIIVYTSLYEPLILKLIANKTPNAVVLRKEALDVLKQCILMVNILPHGTILSPATSDGLTLARDVPMDGKALEVYMINNSCFYGKVAAKLMGVGYKRVFDWRKNMTYKKNRSMYSFLCTS